MIYRDTQLERSFTRNQSVTKFPTSFTDWRVGRVWLNAPAWKAVSPQGHVGSNPTLSGSAIMSHLYVVPDINDENRLRTHLIAIQKKLSE